MVIVQPSEELSSAFQRATMVPLSAMETTSISNNGRPKVTVGKFSSQSPTFSFVDRRNMSHFLLCTNQT